MEALWVLGAYVLGLGASALGLPPLVGYLAAGFGLGVLGLQGGDLLHELAHAGVLLLLFSVGLKLRLASLFRPEVLGVGSLHLLLAGGLTTLLLWPWLGSAAWYVGLGLGFSSTVLAIKLLEEKRELSIYHGRVVVGILVLQDLVAVALLAAAGVKTPTPWALLLLALLLLRPLAMRALERSGHDELLLLFGVGLALGGGSLAEAVGLSGELGALLLGALLAGPAPTTRPRAPLELLGVGLLILLSLPLQLAIFFALFVLFGLRARTAFVSSVALGTFSEFTLITSSAAVRSGVLEESWGTLLALVVAASLVMVAPLNRRVHRLYQHLEPYLLRFERSGYHPDREPTRLGQARWLVVGMGRTGGAAYKLLEREGERVVGLDADPAKLEAHRAKGRRVLYGDAEDPELWERLELSGIKGVLLTMPDFEAKLRAVEGLRRRSFPGLIAVTSYHREEDPIFERAGVSLIFHPFAEAGERLAERALELREVGEPARQPASNVEG